MVQHPASNVDLVDSTARLTPGQAAWLREKTAKSLKAVGAPDGSDVRVRVVDDAEMAGLHGRFSHDPTTTDVLTFNLGQGPCLDADLFVCLDVAARAAADRSHPVERELLLYIIHGVLHCLGHDDHDDGAAAAMHTREDEVLTAIGVGVTFARPASGEGA